MDNEGIEQRLANIGRRIAESEAKRSEITVRPQRSVRLVAVSKLQSIDAIVSAYEFGQRVFGENYIQELCQKCSDSKILSLCPDIEWRLIGHFQSNKVNQLLNHFKDVSRLIVETIDSKKLAKTLETALARTQQTLRVMVQINTSAEENKNGVAVEEVMPLVETIRDECPHLHVIGLMTIGSVQLEPSGGPNHDFATLVACSERVATALSVDTESLDLSFGMTADFEEAIAMGSTEVRIGSAIFGQRVQRV